MNKIVLKSNCVHCKLEHVCREKGKVKYPQKCVVPGRSHRKYPCDDCTKSEKSADGTCGYSCVEWVSWIYGEHGFDANAERLRKKK